jgi:hypothetical protein
MPANSIASEAQRAMSSAPVHRAPLAGLGGVRLWRSPLTSVRALAQYEARNPSKSSNIEHYQLPNKITASTPRQLFRQGNPYCRVSTKWLHNTKGLVSYTIPRIDVQVSGSWQSVLVRS